MRISRVVIENFRAVKRLEFEPGTLCTLIGENNSGKSTIMRALNLVLGEAWPTERSFSEDDFYDRDTTNPIVIQVYFDSKLTHTARNGATAQVSGFELRCKCYKRRTGDKLAGDLGIDFVCIGPRGGQVDDPTVRYRPGGPPLPPLRVSGTLREQVPLLYVDVMREYSKQDPSSRWSVLRRLVQQVQLEFRNDKSAVAVTLSDGTSKKMTRAEAFDHYMVLANESLRTQALEELEQELATHALEQMGLDPSTDGVALRFGSHDPINAFKSLELLVDQLGITSSASHVGAGLQSAIVVAIFRTYEALKKGGAIFAIEEPEAFLHPQKARYFAEVLEKIADGDNQVFLTTHSPYFVKLHKPESIASVRRTASSGTLVKQANLGVIAPTMRDVLKLQTKLTASRSEMLFARRVLLIEGETEALAMPFVFDLLGVDPNNLGISVVDCGSKTAIPFYANILKAFDIPFVVLADFDSTSPIQVRQTEALRACTPASDLFLMNPDFEGECGYAAGDKVLGAFNHFTSTPSPAVPKAIADAVSRLVTM